MFSNYLPLPVVEEIQLHTEYLLLFQNLQYSFSPFFWVSVFCPILGDSPSALSVIARKLANQSAIITSFLTRKEITARSEADADGILFM